MAAAATFVAVSALDAGSLLAAAGSADFAASGGVFTNQEVTYRGVLVGQVGEMTLGEDGVNVQLLIDPGKELRDLPIADRAEDMRVRRLRRLRARVRLLWFRLHRRWQWCRSVCLRTGSQSGSSGKESTGSRFPYRERSILKPAMKYV